MLTPYGPVPDRRSSGGSFQNVLKSRLKSKHDFAFAIRTPRLLNNAPKEIKLTESKHNFIDMLLCDVVLLLAHCFYSLIISLFMFLFLYFIVIIIYFFIIRFLSLNPLLTDCRHFVRHFKIPSANYFCTI